MSDKNFKSFCGERPLGRRLIGDLIPPDGTYSDTLKVTDCADGELYAGHVVGGKEDCCDINNHTSNVRVAAELWEPRGDYGFTIKGGSTNITVAGRYRGHGKVVDVDAGNISDQSDDITGPIYLCLDHELGPQEPITVRILGAMRPVLLNPSQKYVFIFEIPGFWKSVFLKVYKQLKKILPI